MKSSKNSIIKVARLMFRNSLTGGRIDEKKVRGVIKGLISTRKRGVIEILKAYRRLVLNLIDEQRAVVESANHLTDLERDQLVKLLRKIYQKKLDVSFRENSELLGGLRIRVGDTIWDASLQGRLLTMKEIYE